MTAAPVVKRLATRLLPDNSRVLVRPFRPGTDERVRHILNRVLALSEPAVEQLLAEVLAEFGNRHPQICRLFESQYEQIKTYLPAGATPSDNRRLLIGSYFTQEYSLESAALFNPSIVPHPNQADVPPGALRFILSLRATGEGHISSITFRTGLVTAAGEVELVAPTRFVTEPRRIPNATYEKALFARKLQEVGLTDPFTRRIVGGLPEAFTLDQLRSALGGIPQGNGNGDTDSAAQSIWLLALSNYEVEFHPDQHLSERVIFPSSPSQSNGIEDARFVLFRYRDGGRRYYATYTAYDGRIVLPQLVETTDFRHFKFSTLNGPAVRNKGMALFPRQINGLYAMLSRQDNENIFLMYSENIHFWYEPQRLLGPEHAWEFVQMGNCGSPIETEDGWLVLSHGVGPMRRYCIGAFLLDLKDPNQVRGRLREPLIVPGPTEREGYVPNVVYTCGALVHRGQLIIPYAMADYATGFATVPVADLLAAMK